MSDRDEERGTKAGAGSTEPQRDKRSGRVTFDERGNSVWEWQIQTGVYSRDVSTQRLKKMEFGELAIAETPAPQQPEHLRAPAKTSPESGFNPYDNAPRSRAGADPYNTARALGAVGAPTAQREPKEKRRTLDDMRRLSEFIKKQKQGR
jgi:hypothetical protein